VSWGAHPGTAAMHLWGRGAWWVYAFNPRQWAPSGAPGRTAKAPPGNPDIHRTLPPLPCGGCPVLHTGTHRCQAGGWHLPPTRGPPHGRGWEGMFRCIRCDWGGPRKGDQGTQDTGRALHLLGASLCVGGAAACRRELRDKKKPCTLLFSAPQPHQTSDTEGCAPQHLGRALPGKHACHPVPGMSCALAPHPAGDPW
jgi:hypothetical protein